MTRLEPGLHFVLTDQLATISRCLAFADEKDERAFLIDITANRLLNDPRSTAIKVTGQRIETGGQVGIKPGRNDGSRFHISNVYIC